MRAALAAAMRRPLALLALAAVVAGACPAPAAAWLDEAPARALTGTLADVARSGVVRLGYRDDAAPFSFVTRAGVPAGYSIDLCRAVVAAIREAIGGHAVSVEFVRVGAADRLERIEAGDVDLECGSTSVTPQRSRRVAFSPAIFMAGTRLAVARGSRVRSIGDLGGGRGVAAVRGTTNEEVVREVARLRGIGLRVEPATDLEAAFALLDAGRVAAVAGDDILLLGQLVRAGRRDDFAIVGEPLSYDRYALAFRRGDDAFGAVVDAALRDLAASGELRRTYNKWFVRTLPTGVRLGWPMGPELRRAFELLGQPPA